MSRLGQHNAGAVTDWTQRALIVKQFNSGAGTLSSVPNNSIRVIRHYFANQTYAPGCGVDTANTVIADLNGYRHPQLYVELYNEPNQGDIGPLCQMIQEAVPVIHNAGLRVAAFSWGTGQPEASLWQYVRDSWGWCGLDPAIDAIALHEYSNDYTIDGWNMGRFQNLINFDPRWNILITETGFDNGGTNSNGWIANGNNLSQYNSLLQSYDALIKQHPQVLGATVFQTGLLGWSNFEYDDPNQLFTAAEIRAERAYNLLTNGAPFIPGKQYVQQNGYDAYEVVVTYTNLSAAEVAYNQITGGKPFIPGNRYVQDNGDGTYTVVVSFDLA